MVQTHKQVMQRLSKPQNTQSKGPQATRVVASGQPGSVSWPGAPCAIKAAVVCV